MTGNIEWLPASFPEERVGQEKYAKIGIPSLGMHC